MIDTTQKATDLIAEVGDADDADELIEAYNAELAGKQRSTVLAAMEGRMEKLGIEVTDEDPTDPPADVPPVGSAVAQHRQWRYPPNGGAGVLFEPGEAIPGGWLEKPGGT